MTFQNMLKNNCERLVNNMKKILLVFGFLFLFGLIFGITQMIQNPEKYSTTNNNEESSVKTLIDSSQFSRISISELIEIMEEPDNIEKWNYKSPNGNEYDAITYSYGDYEFLIIDGSVVRFNFYGKQTFKTENDLFSLFGIKPSENIKKVVDNNLTLKYHLVSNKIAEFLITNINKENKSFDTVKITYNLNYFD